MSTGIRDTYNKYRTEYYLPKIKKLFNTLPEAKKDVIKNGYYLGNPRRSWRSLQRKQQAYERFIDRFFESEAEFEHYKQEFFATNIFEVVQSGLEETREERYFFDTHLNVCVNYYCLIRKRKPETVIETGVYNGIATTAILLALDANNAGTLYSIDYSHELGPPEQRDTTSAVRFYDRSGPSCGDSTVVPHGKKAGWLVPEELTDRWQFSAGDSRDELPALLSELDQVDFFVHDSERSKTRMLFEFDLVWGQLSPDGLMLSGHVAYNDAFETFASERECDHGIYDVLWDPEPNPKRCYSSRNPSKSGYIMRASG